MIVETALVPVRCLETKPGRASPALITSWITNACFFESKTNAVTERDTHLRLPGCIAHNQDHNRAPDVEIEFVGELCRVHAHTPRPVPAAPLAPMGMADLRFGPGWETCGALELRQFHRVRFLRLEPVDVSPPGQITY